MATGANAVIQLNNATIRAISEADIKAAIGTANSIRLDVQSAQTVPFLTGAMYGSEFVDTSDIQRKGIRIMYSTPYVGYQYFTPGLNHYLGQHANATDHWLDPYLTGGTKAGFAEEKYRQHFITELRRL